MERSSLGIVINVDGKPAANVLCKMGYDIKKQGIRIRKKDKQKKDKVAKVDDALQGLIRKVAHAKLKLRQLTLDVKNINDNDKSYQYKFVSLTSMIN